MNHGWARDINSIVRPISAINQLWFQSKNNNNNKKQERQNKKIATNNKWIDCISWLFDIKYNKSLPLLNMRSILSAYHNNNRIFQLILPFKWMRKIWYNLCPLKRNCYLIFVVIAGGSGGAFCAIALINAFISSQVNNTLIWMNSVILKLKSRFFQKFMFNHRSMHTYPVNIKNCMVAFRLQSFLKNDLNKLFSERKKFIMTD